MSEDIYAFVDAARLDREQRDELVQKLTFTVAWKGMSREERSRAEACASVFLDALDDLGLKLTAADKTTEDADG